MIWKPTQKQKELSYLGYAQQVGFIVGTGRSGTTILAQVLNSHSRICVPHELQIIVGINNGARLYEKYINGEIKKYRANDFINLISQHCPYYFEQFFDYRDHFRQLVYPQTDLRQILQELFDHICYQYHKAIFLEQTPWYGQRLKVLKELFPEMKVIHMIRDGRDVAESFARTPWWSKDVNQNLRQWAVESKNIYDFGQENPGNFLEVRYEDLVLEPEIWLKKILSLFGLDYEEIMLEPKNLINYSSMFKGKSLKNISGTYQQWINDKKTVFFPENVYAWKRGTNNGRYELTPEIKNILSLFHYEI